ncbi:MAG: adenylate/guanylate cyclase domain-containing protein, partial [Aliifodinibius sp.]|nr:adenylate/guanylate cyclase domain-containing protein [Fodinibius sp.]
MPRKFNAERKNGTVLFCDIRNFTHLFEAEDPLKAVTFANTVLAELGTVVERGGGAVDRFTGDGFLAHFGVIQDDDAHIESACKVAIEMRAALQEINAQRYVDVESVVTIGIGIHTGELAYGEIKTEQINQKTVLGDVVNTAARIEELTKYFSVDILLSELSYKSVREEYNFQRMPARKLSGKKDNVVTHWLLPM